MPTSQIDTQGVSDSAQLSSFNNSQPDNASVASEERSKPLVDRVTLSPEARKTLATEQVSSVQETREVEPSKTNEAEVEVEKVLSNAQLRQQVSELSEPSEETNKAIEAFVTETARSVEQSRKASTQAPAISTGLES